MLNSSTLIMCPPNTPDNFSKSFTCHKKGLIPGLPINLDSYPCITFLQPPFFCMLKCVQFLQELYMTWKRSDSWSANQSWFLSMHHFFTGSLLLHAEMCAICPRALHITRRWMAYNFILNSGECRFQLLFIYFVAWLFTTLWEKNNLVYPDNLVLSNLALHISMWV